MVHFDDLDAIQSFVAEFFWTSRFQNHNLQGLNLIWTAFHQDLTTGPRDIQDFVKKKRKMRMPFSLQFAPLLRYKVLLFDRESNLRLY